MSKTLGLALGSGGARGVAHVGFIQALEEEGIKPDYIAGCSMGAVVGGCYASGMTTEEMRAIVLRLKKRDIIDISPKPISQMSILRSKKIRDLLVQHLKIKNIEDFPLPFKCVSTDLLSGKLHVFEEGDAALAIQASSSIPAVFRPVKYRDKLLVDGGCLCRVPVEVVKEMNADVVVAVDVLKNSYEPVEKLDNILSMILRMFDVMDAHTTELLRDRDRGICDLWLEPEMKGISQYKMNDLDRAYEEGYALGKANVKKIKELLE